MKSLYVLYFAAGAGYDLGRLISSYDPEIVLIENIRPDITLEVSEKLRGDWRVVVEWSVQPAPVRRRNPQCDSPSAPELVRASFCVSVWQSREWCEVQGVGILQRVNQWDFGLCIEFRYLVECNRFPVGGPNQEGAATLLDELPSASAVREPALRRHDRRFAGGGERCDGGDRSGGAMDVRLLYTGTGVRQARRAAVTGTQSTWRITRPAAGCFEPLAQKRNETGAGDRHPGPSGVVRNQERLPRDYQGDSSGPAAEPRQRTRIGRDYSWRANENLYDIMR